MSFDFNNIDITKSNNILDIKKVIITFSMSIVPLDIPKNGHHEIQCILLNYFENLLDNQKYTVNRYDITDPVYKGPSKIHNIFINCSYYCITYYAIIKHVHTVMNMFNKYAYDNKFSLTWHSLNLKQDSGTAFNNVLIGKSQANKIDVSKVILENFNIDKLILLENIPYIKQIIKNCTVNELIHYDVSFLTGVNLYNTYDIDFKNIHYLISDSKIFENYKDYIF